MLDDSCINESLYKCLEKFEGATPGNNLKEREDSLIKPFTLLAKKLLYGGYFEVRNEYRIYIHTVEFYYHEEIEHPEPRILDEKVYHRNGKFKDPIDPRVVPYFPLMTLHSHWSGFDITFENGTEGHYYRASALIRKYAVYDINAMYKGEKGCYVKWVKTDKEERYDKSNKPIWDNRSSYLQYYLNGFSINGDYSGITWQKENNPDYSIVPIPDYRQNIDYDKTIGRKWAFKRK